MTYRYSLLVLAVLGPLTWALKQPPDEAAVYECAHSIAELAVKEFNLLSMNNEGMHCQKYFEEQPLKYANNYRATLLDVSSFLVPTPSPMRVEYDCPVTKSQLQCHFYPLSFTSQTISELAAEAVDNCSEIDKDEFVKLRRTMSDAFMTVAKRQKRFAICNREERESTFADQPIRARFNSSLGASALASFIEQAICFSQIAAVISEEVLSRTRTATEGCIAEFKKDEPTILTNVNIGILNSGLTALHLPSVPYLAQSTVAGLQCLGHCFDQASDALSAMTPERFSHCPPMTTDFVAAKTITANSFKTVGKALEAVKDDRLDQYNKPSPCPAKNARACGPRSRARMQKNDWSYPINIF